MTYFACIGDLKQEFTDYHHETGKYHTFHDAIEILYRKDKLFKNVSFTAFQHKDLCRRWHNDFPKIVGSIALPVKLDLEQGGIVAEEETSLSYQDIYLFQRFCYVAPMLHSHDFVEMNYVAEGTCTVCIDDERRQMDAGEMCIIPPGLKHDIEIKDEATIYCIQIRKDRFQLICASLPVSDALQIPDSFFDNKAISDWNQVSYLKTEELKWMQMMLDNCMIESFKLDEYSNLFCFNLVSIILVHLLRASAEADVDPEEQKDSSFSPVIRYIQKHYDTLTLSQLAAEFHYTKEHLCTLIKKNTGTSFSNLIRRSRMIHALEYLLYTDKPISEIAELVGYHSTDHFSRVFRAYFGISAIEYRKNKQKKSEWSMPFGMSV